ncbi:phospholipase A2 inhibitor and Ly6/PLAUR domain-containing protein-like [Natator depressus]|uniref:phospholipase A2 inhibitor and Ly6/PLAUR domain-containing protein-like n=1 Tax=Natator depressus TaxID=27790 RepID=UPI003EB87FA4
MSRGSRSRSPRGQCPSFFKIWADGWQEKEKELLACTGAEDHCVEESGILTLGGITLTKIAAGCVSPGTCVKRVGEKKYAQGVVEMLKGYSLSYMGKSCLESKNCEPGPFSVTYAHNVTCPSCFTQWTGSCKDNEPLACTGAEDHCFEESGILIVAGITLRQAAVGCGSPGACVKRAGLKKYVKGVLEWIFQAKCYPAPRAGRDIRGP